MFKLICIFALFLVAICVFNTPNALAQKQIGVVGGYNSVKFNGTQNFNSENFICHPVNDTNVYGSGYYAGLQFKYQFEEFSSLSIVGTLQYDNSKGEFIGGIDNYSTLITSPDSTFRSVATTTAISSQFSLEYLSLRITAQATPFGTSGLTITAGYRVSYLVNSKATDKYVLYGGDTTIKFTHQHPKYPLSEDGRSYTLYDAKVPNANKFVLGANLQLSYDFVLFDLLHIVPEIGVDYDITTIMKDSKWRRLMYSVGMAITVNI